MNSEEHFFIQILSDYLAQRHTDKQKDLDWNKILQLAQAHQVEGIIYNQCKDLLPDSVRSTFEKAYGATVFQYMNRMADLEEIRRFFNAASVPFFTVKGPIIAGYYPIPELRTMGDADLVIRAKDREKSDVLMKSMGFTSPYNGNEEEYHYDRRGLAYELHECLVHHNVATHTQADDFFNNFWLYVKDGKLDPSFHFLFLLKHLQGHFMISGVGFRQFMDVAVMGKNESALNWSWIQEKLDEIGMLDFAKNCIGFIYKWFGIKMPIEMMIPDDNFYEIGTEGILNNGVFGFNNEENQKNHTLNDARKAGGIGMVKNALGYVFMPYSKMKTLEAYSYLKDRPYLFPVAWIHRLGRGVKNFSNSKKTMARNFASKEEISKRDKYLKKWGL